MSKGNAAQIFSEMVTQKLDSETRELWQPMSDNFQREGPDAVKIYLDANLDRLKGRVSSLFEQFQEG